MTNAATMLEAITADRKFWRRVTAVIRSARTKFGWKSTEKINARLAEWLEINLLHTGIVNTEAATQKDYSELAPLACDFYNKEYYGK